MTRTDGGKFVTFFWPRRDDEFLVGPAKRGSIPHRWEQLCGESSNCDALDQSGA